MLVHDPEIYAGGDVMDERSGEDVEDGDYEYYDDEEEEEWEEDDEENEEAEGKNGACEKKVKLAFAFAAVFTHIFILI